MKDSKKSKKKNSITLKSQFKHLVGFFVTLSACAFLFLIDSHDGTFETFKYLVGCVIVIVLLVSFLHIQYLYFNIGIKIEFLDNETIVLLKNGKEKSIKESDIISIEKNISYASASGGRYILPTDYYYYEKIILKNGDFVIITSLLLDDFNLFPKKVIIKKKLIALIT